jgi:hypothetical protein
MLPGDRQQFAATLTGLAAIKPGARLTPEALELWWSAMQTWSIEDFRSAANHLARSCEFMPSPFHFEQLRKAGRRTAAEAWEKARKACGSCVQLGHYTDDGTCGDELIDRAVAGIGGYKVIAQCNTDSLHFLERRFSEHYETLRDVTDTRETLPRITGNHSGPRIAADVAQLANAKPMP